MKKLTKQERKQLHRDTLEAKRLMITLKGYYERLAYQQKCQARLAA